MPTASQSLRDLMNTYFRNGGIDLVQPLEFLIKNGWKENDGFLIKPQGRDPTEKEGKCAQFLIDEWDFFVS
jgi:hypothetical protein